MISKKSRKVVAALLIGATMCASGTFAYFNSKADMDNITGIDADKTTKLAITNGKVKIEGKMANSSEGVNISAWTYDVARVSTIKDKAKLESMLEKAGLITEDEDPDDFAGTNTDGTLNLASLNSGYTSINRSPDLVGTEAIASLTSRVPLGSAVTGSVTKARPGDAFVLGKDSYDAQGELTDANGGIEIVNNSNIATKIGFRLNLNGTEAEEQAKITALTNAGWKIYLRIQPATGYQNSVNNKYSDWTEFNLTDFIQSGKAVTYELAALAGGTQNTGIKLQARVELPLVTDNTKQDLATAGSKGVPADGIDITKLFEVVATQENNPGWAQDGTTPAAGAPFTDKSAGGTDEDQ